MTNANRVEISPEVQIIELSAVEASLKQRTLLLGQLLRNADQQLAEAADREASALERVALLEKTVEEANQRIQFAEAKVGELDSSLYLEKQKVADLEAALAATNAVKAAEVNPAPVDVPTAEEKAVF